jgi:hypothetical protein
MFIYFFYYSVPSYLDAHAFYTEHFTKLVSSDCETIKNVNATVDEHDIPTKRKRRQPQVFGFHDEVLFEETFDNHEAKSSGDEEEGVEDADEEGSDSEKRGMLSVLMSSRTYSCMHKLTSWDVPGKNSKVCTVHE